MHNLVCQRCGYEWAPRTESPKECPACKSRLWGGKKSGALIPVKAVAGIPEDGVALVSGESAVVARVEAPGKPRSGKSKAIALTTSDRLRQMREEGS